MMLILLSITVLPQAALATMAEPEPDFDNPRKIVISLSEKDEGRVNAVLNKVINIQKFYEQDFVRIAVVAYGPAPGPCSRIRRCAHASKA